MTRCLPLLALLSLGAIAQAAQETILVPEVDVRSGPSTAFYVTGKLRYGDRVEVQAQPANGYVKIDPPLGSFSLILKADVQLQGNGAGVVIKPDAGTRMGGVTTRYEVPGAKLALNTPVRIIGEETLTTGQGAIVYYKITPVNEHRYIPVEAIQKSEIIQTSGTGPGLSDPSRGAPKMSPAVAAKMQAAEQAYARAKATKSPADWNEALRLWKELEQCGEHDAQMTAYNRRYFIEQEMNGGRQSTQASPVSRNGFRDNLTPAGPARPGAMQPRSTYTYSQEGAPSRLSPLPPSPPAPAGSARPPADRNANQAKYIPPPAAPASGNTLLPGKLVRSSKTDINGKPLYVLLDSQNQIKCYVAPPAGQNLERFIEQNVQVQGDGMVYQAFLRNNLVVATDVRLLN